MRYILFILVLFSLLFSKEQEKIGNGKQNDLNENKIIRVCTNPNWKPIEFSDNGDPKGISIDMIKLIGQKLGLTLDFIPTISWEQSQKFLEEKRCDILPAAVKTFEREKYAFFTKPYLSYPLAIVTKSNRPYITSLEDLKDKTVSRKKATGLINVLKEKFPHIKVFETKDALKALEAVQKGDAYFTLITVPVWSFYKNRYDFDDLYISGYAKMNYQLAIAVRKDKKELVSILEKGIDLLSDEEYKIIYHKWTQKSAKIAIHKESVIQTLIVVTVFLLLFIYRYISIRKYNKKLEKTVKKATSHLKKKNKEMLSQYKMQKELAEGFESLLNAAMEAIIVSDENQKIVVANHTALSLFQFDRTKDIKMLEIKDFVPEKELHKLYEALNEEISAPYEIELMTIEKRLFPALVSGRYYQKGGGRGSE